MKNETTLFLSIFLILLTASLIQPEEIEWLTAETVNAVKAHSQIPALDRIRYDSIVQSMGYRCVRYTYDVPGLYNTDTMWTAEVYRIPSDLNEVPELFGISAENQDTSYQLAAEGLIEGLRLVELPGDRVNVKN